MMRAQAMEILKSPQSEGSDDFHQDSSRQFVQVGKIPSLVPSLYGDGSSVDGKEPDGGSPILNSGGETPKGPLESSLNSSSHSSGGGGPLEKPNNNRMTTTSMTAVPENAAAPSVAPSLPSRRRQRNGRASTTVTRQLSLAKMDTSEPGPSEPMQMSSSKTTTNPMKSTKNSSVPRSSVVPQKGRKVRYSRVQRRQPPGGAVGAPINFQGWSRIPSSRQIGNGSSRSKNENITPRSNNTRTTTNGHVTIQGWSRIETPPKTGNRKTTNQDEQPRIYSVNMATGEMIGAQDYSTGGLYPTTPSGSSTSSRSISLSTLRDTPGKDYGDLGMSEATTLDNSERSRGRQTYVSSAHTRNSHSPTLSPIEGSYSYTAPPHQRQLHLRQQQLRDSTMTSPFALSPMRSVSNRAYTIKEVSVEEEERGNNNRPLKHRIRPSISSKDADELRTNDSSIDTSDADSIISTESTTKETPAQTVESIRLPVDYGDDDGPEIMEDSPRFRSKGNHTSEASSEPPRTSGMGRSASERTTSSFPRPIQPADRAMSYSSGDAKVGPTAQSRFLEAGDSRFRSSAATRGSTMGRPAQHIQATSSDDAGSVESVERPGAVAISREGNESFYEKYRAKGMFTQLNSSEAQLSTASSIDVSPRSQLRDVEGQQPITASVATSSPSRGPTARIPQGGRRQQPLSASVVTRGSTARVSATGVVTVVASNRPDDEEQEGVPRRSLAPVEMVNMHSGKNRRSAKKYGLICIVVFIVLAGGVAGAAVYFSIDAAADKTVPTTQTDPPIIPVTSAPTATPRDPARLEEVLEALLTVSTRETMTNPSSAQSKALEWLAFSDPAQIDPTDDKLVARYLLALFYHSTQGGSWFASDDHLSGRSVCDWKGITCSPSSGNSTREEVISIQLERNNLAGSIPDEISSFTTLQRLYLGGNQIEGSIPASIGNCTSLFEVGLGGNGIDGEIPASIGLLSNLVEMGLENNRLSGELPASIGRLTALSFLSLSRNDITGTLPRDIGNLDMLETLIMQSCKVEELPSEMSQLTRLKQLDFGDNLLFGDLPSFISSMINLVELKLDFNQLSGTIPSFIGNLSNLELLWLSETDISGAIPTELVNLPEIKDLQLHNTRLEGELLETKFCSQNNTLLTTLTSNCGGVNPNVPCSCCTTCF